MANRLELEANLVKQIKNMQVQFNQDSKLREMMIELRKFFKNHPTEVIGALKDQESVKQETLSLSSNLPQSRIPHLIFLLDEILKMKPKSLSSNKPKRQTEFPTPNSDHHEDPINFVIQNQLKSIHEQKTLHSQIKVLLMEIDKLQELLELIRQDRWAIENRRGKYRLPTERLRAERLLRELPGAIIHKKEKIIQLKQALEPKKG